MSRPSKYEKAYQNAKRLQEQHDEDINDRIKKPHYGYKDSEPAVVTKTTLDRQGSKLGRTLFMFVGALVMLVVAGIGLKSVMNHESPVQYVKEGFTANKPAKWTPSSDVADKNYIGGTNAKDQKAAEALEKQGQEYTQGNGAARSSSAASTSTNASTNTSTSANSQASSSAPSSNNASTTVSFTN